MTYINRILTIFFALMLSLLIEASALPLDHYRENSVLSDGRWVKIRVSETGMQYISHSQLKEMGFNDPSKVNVYGYGGRIISEVLNESQIDDLPLLPIVRTDSGICFFGVNTISWKASYSETISYKHSQNYYSNDSYYFLSDRDIESSEMPVVNTVIPSEADDVTYFTERILHEKELAAPGNTGAVLLGEDFRSNSSQTFSFNLTEQFDKDATIEVCFGARTTNNDSQVSLYANGKNINKFTIIKSPSSTHYQQQTSIKKVTDIDNRLDLKIDYNTSGVTHLARLDYIIVNYKRNLKLTNNQLHFYHIVNSSKNIVFNISGVSATTEIWDVSNIGNIKKVNFEINGNVARFSPEGNGLKEYIAFTPGKMSNSPTFVEQIGNQNLHAMPVPDMVIITPAEFISQAERIATLHEEVDSMKVYVFTPEIIYNEFSSGVQDFSAYRKMLKMWHDRSDTSKDHKLGYCLLFGRPTYDNRMITDKVKSSGYPRIPIWQSASSTTESSSYCNDDFIGMLNDCETTFAMDNALISVAIGRMPVKSLKEATQVVDKLINYVKNPNLGAWRNNVMIIADDEDYADHLDQSQSVYKYLRGAGNGKDFIYERLYLDSYPLGTSSSGKSYPQAKERMFKMLDEGTLFVDYIGHANPTSWTHEGLLNYTDILNLSNTNLPFMLTATCEFTRWDDDDISGAELMFLNPTAGAIGFISAIRKVSSPPNGNLNNTIAKNVFKRDKNGLPMRVGDIYREGQNLDKETYGRGANRLRFMLMADPAMRLPSPTLNISIDSIDNVSTQTIVEPKDFPIIPARGKVVVKGRITDSEGNTINDFNGVAVPTLFDAERAIKTYGHGDKGSVRHYNDRKNKLFSGKVPVVNGEWEVTILMPSEIDNNYSPALLNIYAYSEDKREANGSTEKLYVYGWNETAADDFDGPEISLLALNSENFENGDKVNDSPILLANFRDESGINISTSGFGHDITAVVDGNKVYDNLVDFYESNLEDYCSGSIHYPLSGLSVGEHTLTFTIWDNANNSSTQTITFNVSNSITPSITDLRSNVNPASTDVIFYVEHDMPSSSTTVHIEVYDLGGRKVWQSESHTGNDNAIRWDLCDMSGSRVPRSIYLYRAIVTSPQGIVGKATKKLAVTGQ